MPRSVLFIILTFFAVSSLFAQENSSTQASFEPPPRVKANFNARNPQHSESVKWQEKKEGYQATFSRNNKEVVCEFDQNGQWVSTRTDVSEKELPSNALRYMKETYPSYAYEGGHQHETKNSTRYKVTIRSQNQRHQLEFDKDGGLIEDKGSE